MLLLSVQIQEVYPTQYEGQTGTLSLKHKTPWIKKKRNFYVSEKIKGRVFFVDAYSILQNVIHTTISRHYI